MCQSHYLKNFFLHSNRNNIYLFASYVSSSARASERTSLHLSYHVEFIIFFCSFGMFSLSLSLSLSVLCHNSLVVFAATLLLMSMHFTLFWWCCCCCCFFSRFLSALSLSVERVQISVSLFDPHICILFEAFYSICYGQCTLTILVIISR